MTPPQVKVTIISESQANMLIKSEHKSCKSEASGEILNNTGTMEFQQATRQLSVSFRNMQLKKIKRTEKKGTISAQPCLIFYTHLTFIKKTHIFDAGHLCTLVKTENKERQVCKKYGVSFKNIQRADPEIILKTCSNSKYLYVVSLLKQNNFYLKHFFEYRSFSRYMAE